MTNQSAKDVSFLASPEELADWRMVLAYEVAADAGVIDALPGTLPDLAGRRRAPPSSSGSDDLQDTP